MWTTRAAGSSARIWSAWNSLRGSFTPQRGLPSRRAYWRRAWANTVPRLTARLPRERRRELVAVERHPRALHARVCHEIADERVAVRRARQARPAWAAASSRHSGSSPKNMATSGCEPRMSRIRDCRCAASRPRRSRRPGAARSPRGSGFAARRCPRPVSSERPPRPQRRQASRPGEPMSASAARAGRHLARASSTGSRSLPCTKGSGTQKHPGARRQRRAAGRRRPPSIPGGRRPTRSGRYACALGARRSEIRARAMRRVQLRGGARRQPARRTFCTLSRLSRDAAPAADGPVSSL